MTSLNAPIPWRGNGFLIIAVYIQLKCVGMIGTTVDAFTREPSVYFKKKSSIIFTLHPSYG